MILRQGKIDRTPSFYTSRSIINLSGLSVSDRAPDIPRRKSSKSEGETDKLCLEHGARYRPSIPSSPHPEEAVSVSAYVSAPASEVTVPVSAGERGNHDRIP